MYNGLLQLVGTSPGSGNFAEGIATLLLAASVALGIAAGATLGTYLGRPIVGQLRRIRRRYASTAIGDDVSKEGDHAWLPYAS